MDGYQTDFEGFDMSKDYADRQWVDGECHYRKRKEAHQQTKEEALYGIFDESDSDQQKGKRRRRGDVMKNSNLTKPVNFVSTTIVKSVEESVKKVGTEEDGDAERRALGFSPQRKKLKVEEEIEVEDHLPTGFGRQIFESAQRKQREREQKVKDVALGPKSNSVTSRVSTGINSNLGTFEQHTKGIGMKILKKTGYLGGGLGKDAQGIEAPVEAKLRPQKMGMGFKAFRETMIGLPNAPGQGEELKAKVARSKENHKPSERLWHARNQNKRKSNHKSDAELLTERQRQGQGVETVQTVLDMRPVTKVLTNLENLNVDQLSAIVDDTPVPELQHNIRLLVELVEAEILLCDKKLAEGRDSVVLLAKETEQLQSDLMAQRQQIRIMETITNGAPVENVSSLRVTEQREFELQEHAAYQAQHVATKSHETENNGAENTSLKEIVEDFAQQNDVEFTPKVGRVHKGTGLQVYGFGMVRICMDSVKQMVLAQKKDRWLSVSLGQLLEMQRSRSGSRWK